MSEMRIPRADGSWLVAVDEGRGPTVVLLHGATRSLADWALITPALVARGFRVVALDLRGHGRSPTGDWSYDAAVADVECALAHLGIERAVVVGHSLGGLLAIAAGARSWCMGAVDLDGFADASLYAEPGGGTTGVVRLLGLQDESLTAMAQPFPAAELGDLVELLIGGADVPREVVTRCYWVDGDMAHPRPDAATSLAVRRMLDATDLAALLDACSAPLLVVRAAREFDPASAPADPEWLGPLVVRFRRRVDELLAERRTVQVVDVDADHMLLLTAAQDVVEVTAPFLEGISR